MSRRQARQHGLAAVEFALVLPVLAVIALAIMELGHAVLTRQILLNVSREAANLAARGTALDAAIAAVQASASPLDLAADGRVILTEVQRSVAGVPTVQQQRGAGAGGGASRIGAVGGPALLPPTAVAVPPAGYTLFVAEVYYRSAALTPLGALLGIDLADMLYDVAYF